MKQKKIVKFLVCFKSGLVQLILIEFKNDKDLERFKALKFKNVINIDEVN